MRLPEGTPPNVALTKVLVACGLLNEQLHLHVNIQSALILEVVAWNMTTKVTVINTYTVNYYTKGVSSRLFSISPSVQGILHALSPPQTAKC